MERSAIKLDEGLAPADVAPYADAGLTAYRAVKKAVALLPPGARCVVIGIGGLGHIGLQCLRAMTGAEIVALDASDEALQMAAAPGRRRGGEGRRRRRGAVRELSHGRGAEVVLDFVGEGGTTAQGPAMLAGGGTYFVIGYGGRVELDAIEIISREISVVGSLVGSFSELCRAHGAGGAGQGQARDPPLRPRRRQHGAGRPARRPRARARRAGAGVSRIAAHGPRDKGVTMATRTPQEVFQHHGQVLGAGDIEGIVSDYA